MCGLAGYNFNIENIELGKAIEKNLMVRGPDQQGQFYDQNVRLISTRLKVQDLDAGDQPYSEANSPWILLYNGELYNKSELQKLLESKDHNFTSHSDTEVIYKSFLHFGKESFSKFNGMFALALYNKESSELLLKTDRYGVKPLYFLKEGERFIFSSHLTTFKIINPSIHISEKGLAEFLKYNYTTFDTTLYHGVRRLRPSSLISINLKDLSLKEVHYEDFFKKTSHNKENLLAEVLDNAIEGQLISDRKTGVFLSSGIDSSFIAAKAFQKNHNIRAFNISFTEESYDEFPLAKIQADFSGINLEKHNFNEDVFLKNFHNFVSGNDSPLADPGLFPLFHLCNEIKNTTTVLLSGDGGDELFAGYSTIMATMLVKNSPSFLRPALSTVLTSASKLFKSNHKNMLSYKMEHLGHNFNKSIFEAHSSWRNVFSYSELSEMAPDLNITKNTFNESYLKYLEDAQDLFPNDIINQLLYLDFKHWLPLNNFLKLDIATSSHSLEGRVPYLDNKLVDFLFSIKGADKWSPLKNKRLLRNESKGIVAPAILKGTKKPFHPPYRVWLRGQSKKFLEDSILNSSLIQNYGLKKDVIKRIIEENAKGKADHTFKIYNLLYLSKWLELH